MEAFPVLSSSGLVLLLVVAMLVGCGGPAKGIAERHLEQGTKLIERLALSHG